MGLESVTHIGDLNASNPTTGDDVAEGDDHIRNIKTALLTDFPNIDAACNPTPTEFNVLASVTPGTSAASKAVVLDASSKIDTLDLTAWKIGGVSVTSTPSELNILDGVTSTTAELNVLDGIPGTLTPTELGYVDGVTSAIQTQIDAIGITLGTPVATTSGTAIDDYNSIPAGTKTIVVTFVGVSTSGTSQIMIQLGDAGGIETSGYSGAAKSTLSAGTNVVALSAGFALGGTANHKATYVLSGSITLSLEDSSDYTWTCEGGLGNSTTDAILNYVAGSKSLSAELDRIRITTVGGSDTFDAGEVNIQYE